MRIRLLLNFCLPLVSFLGIVTAEPSPTTLSIDDLQRHFGDLSKMNIVEIAGGNGEQCQLLYDHTGFASYTIIDSQDHIDQAKEYLEGRKVSDVRFFSNDELEAGQFDLVLCNLSFSNLDCYEQKQYINKLMAYAPRGYVIWDTPSKSSLSLEGLIATMCESKIAGVVRPLRPQIAETPQVIIWNVDSSKAFERTLKSLMPSSQLQPGCAVTCEMDGGRLADNLLAYLHAKWISYKYGIPVLYKPFQYADQLMLSAIDKPLSNSYKFQNHVWLHHGRISEDRDLDPQAFSTLYEVPWFPESTIELEIFPFYKPKYFAVDWKDPGFHNEVLQTIQPKSPLALPKIPQDRIVVAVHVRTGDGFDSPESYKVLPTKFPPLDYYTEQIKRIADIYKDEPLYIYLFTDSHNPKKLAEKFELAVNNSNLQFLFREKGNAQDRNVLEDLFALTECDCLIRGESYFSLLASKLTDYKVMITPASYQFEGDKLTITQVNIHFGDKK